MSEKLLLTTDEAAERLGVSKRHMERLIATKAIRSVKVGKLRRVSAAALTAYVDELEAAEAQA